MDSPAGLDAAVAGGADRIELCAALALSGMTPSPGLMALAAEKPLPVHAMIRPRPGDFRYGTRDLDAMRRDIDAVRATGLAGVVFGALRQDGRLDEGALSLLIRHAEGLSLTLHRAFDLTPDLGAALETAVALGFNTILTSGGARTAVEGSAQIEALVKQANGRIAVLAGSGLNPGNVAELVRATGADQVHASCGAVLPPSQVDSVSHGKALEYGFFDERLRQTDQAAVAAMIRALETLA